MIATTRKLPLFAALVCGCLALPALADDQFADLKNQTEDITNLIDAENSKSALCKSYVGKPVAPTTFAALAVSLPKVATKGEFETTAQFQARIASTAPRGPAKLAVLVLPVDRSFVRYDADIGAMFVSAGSLNSGEYSDETGAEISAIMATRSISSKGTPVFVEQRSKVVRTYAAQNLFGASFRVTEIDRTTHAVHLANVRLFPFAKRDSSPIMSFEVSQALARRTKETLRLALIIKPKAPFVLSYTFEGSNPTALEPNHYTDRATVMVAEAQCALVLDDHNQVIASADTGK